MPGVRLNYNAACPYQMFGTEPHDFVAACLASVQRNLTRSRAERDRFTKGERQRHDYKRRFSAMGLLHAPASFNDDLAVAAFNADTHASRPLLPVFF
jgi:hypothetical protein